MEAAIERAARYVEAGADLIFAEALTDVAQYRRFTQALNAPVLANMTEFGRSPLLTVDELKEAGIRLVLYPLTAFRAMSAAAVRVYETVRVKGTQAELLSSMQTREALYDVLDYHSLEARLDREQ